ncbi:MAG TPA: type II CAAX endopeptidase family protein [Gemmatimonadaceae bacterium]|nr:type II CAAX endopeptidase family protein [Gemmatimonadaceae bacterium]
MLPTPADIAFAFTLIVLTAVFEHYWFWPRFKAGVASGAPNARVDGYRRGIIGQWLFTVIAAGMWVGYRRPASALRLTLPSTWHIVTGAVLVAVTLALGYYQLASVRRLAPERRVAVRPRLGAIAFLIPHTPREHRWFLGLSLTAGFCEEFLYRGYLTWFLSPWLGAPLAMLVVVIAFGFGHAYQGRRGAIRATIAGAVMGGVVLATNWLVPAMIIHALVDASSGTAGYLIMREREPEPERATTEDRAPALEEVTTS